MEPTQVSELLWMRTKKTKSRRKLRLASPREGASLLFCSPFWTNGYKYRYKREEHKLQNRGNVGTEDREGDGERGREKITVGSEKARRRKVNEITPLF